MVSSFEKTSKKVIFSILFCFLFVFPTMRLEAASGTVKIKMKVMEKGNARPISRVEIRNGSDQVYTDKKGLAEINIPATGNGKIQISRAHYESLSISYQSLRKGKKGIIFFYLYPGNPDDEVILVQGERRNSSSKKHLSGDEASKIAPGGDAAKIVELMPGVQLRTRGGGPPGGGRNMARGAPPSGGRGGPPGGGRMGPPPGGGGAMPAPPTGATAGPPPGGEGGGSGAPGSSAPGGGGPGGSMSGMARLNSNAGIIIRGSAPEDSKYYIDDLEAPYLFHSIGDLSVVPGPLLDQVEFESGGFGAEYGNASGGIVRLLTKKDIPEQPKTEFTVNAPYYAGIYHRRPLSEESALSVSVRRSYIDHFAKEYYDYVEMQNKRENFAETPVFTDGHAMYTQKIPSGYRKFTLLGSQDGTKVVTSNNFSSGSDSSFESTSSTTFAVFGIEQLSALDKNWVVQTTPQAYYMVVTSENDMSTSSGNTWRGRMPTEFRRRIGKQDKLYLGLDPETTNYKQTTSSDNPFTQTTTDSSKSVKRHGGAGWVAIDEVLGPVKVTPGGRAFFNTQTQKSSYDPRLNISIAVTKSNTVKMAVGQYSKAPELLEADKETGRSDLKYERTFHYILGLETNWNLAWTTEFQGFYKRGINIIESDRQKVYDNDGSNKVYGGEAFIRRNLTSRLFGWLTYTYSKTMERPNDSEKFKRSTYDQTHVGNLAGSYKLTATWETGLRYRYNTGNTYTPSLGGIYNANADRYQQVQSDSNENSKNLPPRQSMTAYVSKDILFNTWKLSFKGGLESFWFGAQTDSMQANYDYSKDQPVESLNTVPFIEMRGEL